MLSCDLTTLDICCLFEPALCGVVGEALSRACSLPNLLGPLAPPPAIPDGKVADEVRCGLLREGCCCGAEPVGEKTDEDDTDDVDDWRLGICRWSLRAKLEPVAELGPVFVVPVVPVVPEPVGDSRPRDEAPWTEMGDRDEAGPVLIVRP
jgi:hypothetical protein